MARETVPDDARATARTRERPLALLRRAAGSPRELATKTWRLARTLRALADARALDARLARLQALGFVDRVPSRLQLVVGSIDMLRFWIEPAARDYYAQRGIGFGLHQVLRVLDDPASMVDPTGFLVDRDVIIGHLMQVVHANPAYDLQLLESHEDGLESLERQVEASSRGRTPAPARSARSSRTPPTTRACSSTCAPTAPTRARRARRCATTSRRTRGSG